MTTRRRLVRTLLTLTAAAGVVVLGGGVSSPAAAAAPTSCQGVMQGNGDGPLTKSLVSITPGANAGDYTIVYNLQSARPPGVYRVRDCVFIDTGAPGYSGEPFIGGVDEKMTPFTASNGGSSAQVTQEVTGVGPNDQVCDRAAVSGDATGFTDKSNLLCITPNSTPPVPESHLAITLPLAAVGAVGLVLLVQHRRRTAAARAE